LAKPQYTYNKEPCQNPDSGSAKADPPQADSLIPPIGKPSIKTPHFSMTQLNSKQRIYASLMFLGACILLFSSITMVAQGNLGIQVLWVSVLLIAELLVDLGCAVFSVVWWIQNDSKNDRIPLRFGTAAVLLHAFRVLIFVIGRIGPWINFDVRPEHHALHDTSWNMGDMYFTSIMSILGIFGVVFIWQYRRRMKK
jgi:hypothetical protein